MSTDEAFYNIFMYLYNKNVLENARIARNETESRIPYIEGCSTKLHTFTKRKIGKRSTFRLSIIIWQSGFCQ